jgi:hypothetical protein
LGVCKILNTKLHHITFLNCLYFHRCLFYVMKRVAVKSFTSQVQASTLHVLSAISWHYLMNHRNEACEVLYWKYVMNAPKMCVWNSYKHGDGANLWNVW